MAEESTKKRPAEERDERAAKTFAYDPAEIVNHIMSAECAKEDTDLAAPVAKLGNYCGVVLHVITDDKTHCAFVKQSNLSEAERKVLDAIRAASFSTVPFESFVFECISSGIAIRNTKSEDNDKTICTYNAQVVEWLAEEVVLKAFEREQAKLHAEHPERVERFPFTLDEMVRLGVELMKGSTHWFQTKDNRIINRHSTRENVLNMQISGCL